MNVTKVVNRMLCVGALIGCAASCTNDTALEPTSEASAALGVEDCPPGYNIIQGFEGMDDVLIGTNGDDCILGLSGNDTLEGGNGNDVLIGGPGDDTLLGGNADDVLDGGEGNDMLDGGNGNDTLLGGSGNDNLMAHNGSDFSDGGEGNDVIHGGKGDDALSGAAGNDVIIGGGGNDTTDGGDGVDACAGAGCEAAEPDVGECNECTDGQCIEGTGLCVQCIDDVDCAGEDDGNACTATVCQPLTGCVHEPVVDGAACADGDLCNGDEVCTAGICELGVALDCDDADDCTADACDAETGCSNTPIDMDGNGIPDCDEPTEPPVVCTDADLECGGGPIGCVNDGVCELVCSQDGDRGACARAACAEPCVTNGVACTQEVLDHCSGAQPIVCREQATGMCVAQDRCDTRYDEELDRCLGVATCVISRDTPACPPRPRL